MSQTGRLGLPYIITSQAQKEVTHNEALNRLDAFVTPVVSQITDAPPGSPSVGDLVIVGTSPSGDFAGHANELAQFLTGGWVFYTPFKWMDAVVESLDSRITYNGSAWVSFSLIMQDSGEYLMVPRRGLEPPRPCGHWHLKPARLPIPPPGQTGPSFTALRLGGANSGHSGQCSLSLVSQACY
jgi:hypothetical protein